MTRARSIADLNPKVRAQAAMKLADQAASKISGIRVVHPIGPPAPGNKFHAKAVTADGKKFGSKKEFRCYRELELRQAAGEISDLRCQVKFSLFAAGGECPGEHIGTYSCDFVWKEQGRRVVADAKSEATRRLRDWPRTKALMRMCHNIEVIEL